VEASALQAPAAGVTRGRISLGSPLLRLRSDEQLVALFRAGNDEAFRVIHDRYRQRLFAYTRQMLPGSRQDAEDALQDVFVRAYSSLRSNDRELALRAWLYRVAHNRCVDELRRPAPPAPEMLELVRAPSHDPIAEAEQRESLRRLIEDVRRLPDQQRSALLMRELSGMSYFELAGALGVSVPAVKSLLVRARVSLAQAQEARDTACSEIRDELIVAHDRRVRPNATARRHLRDCAGCREFRVEMRSVSRQLAALVPTVGPAAVVAKALGLGGGASGGAAAGGSAAAGGGMAVAGTGAIAASGALATGASHVATLLAAAVITAGGAAGIQSATSHDRHHARHHAKPAAKVHRVNVSKSVPAPAGTTSSTQATTPATVQSAPPPASPAQSSPAANPSTPPIGHPPVATPPHIPASADSVTLPSSGGSAPADPSRTGDGTSGGTGTGSAPGSATTDGTSTTPTTSPTGTSSSTTSVASSAPGSTGQTSGATTSNPPGALAQTSLATGTSTVATTPTQPSSSAGTASSADATGTSGTSSGGSIH
jgi:RNA polymerase sigma factor (sigma-70 family)